MAVTLLPVLNFRMLPPGEIAHDRYLYLPSVGFVLLVGLAVVQCVGDWQCIPRWAVGAGAVVAVMACLVAGMASARQNLVWSDDLTLYYRAHEVAPRNVCATTSLAASVAQHGMEGAAVKLYEQALAIQPDFWRASLNLAYLYYKHGDFVMAAQYFSRACAVNPIDGDEFLYLGMSLARLDRLAEAEKAVRTALLVRPQVKNGHLGLAMVLRLEGKLSEARQEIAAELAQDGRNEQARNLLDEIKRQIQAQGEKSSIEILPARPALDLK
jgi:tetratricopeptide (TPR) repeat protein